MATTVNSNADINWNPNLDPEQIKQLQQLLGKTTSPYEKGASKAQEELGYAHTAEAIQAGVPPEHIQSQLMNQKMSLLQNLLTSVYGSNSPAQASATARPAETQMSQSATQPNNGQGAQASQSQTNQNLPMSVQQPNNFFQALLGRAQIKQNPDGSINFTPAGALQGYNANTEALKQAGMIQKMSGQEPLQAGEREKISIEGANKFAIEQYKAAVDMSKEGSLKPSDIFTKFETASIPFITARDAYARMQAAAQDASSAPGAADLAIIFNYMKILDPGSTVREGEAASVKAAGSVPERIWAKYNSILNGDSLSPKMRAEILDRSDKLFKSSERQQEKTTEQFKGLASKNGIDFNKVVRDTGIASESGLSVVKTGTLPDGTKVQKMSDGSIRKVQ